MFPRACEELLAQPFDLSAQLVEEAFLGGKRISSSFGTRSPRRSATICSKSGSSPPAGSSQSRACLMTVDGSSKGVKRRFCVFVSQHICER